MVYCTGNHSNILRVSLVTHHSEGFACAGLRENGSVLALEDCLYSGCYYLLVDGFLGGIGTKNSIECVRGYVTLYYRILTHRFLINHYRLIFQRHEHLLCIINHLLCIGYTVPELTVSDFTRKWWPHSDSDLYVFLFHL